MTKDEALKLAMKAMEITGGFDVEILAIKEALAQPEQEPVAWRAWVSKFPQGAGSDWVYVTKPIMKDRIHNQPLYTTPPQRTWVGLTDVEIDQGLVRTNYAMQTAGAWRDGVEWAVKQLQERNT